MRLYDEEVKSGECTPNEMSPIATSRPVTPNISNTDTIPSLIELVIYLKGVNTKGDFVISDNLLQHDMMTFTERKALTIMTKNKTSWNEMTRKNVVRIYPSIRHLTSSNFNPIPHWLNGSQMVALNFQTRGI